MSLPKLRKQIDAVDRSLVELLERRLKLVNAVSAEKKKNGGQVFVPSREKDVLDRALARRKKFPADALRRVFGQIFQVSRSLEENLLIGFLGPAGTYSHEAAIRLFGTDVTYVPFKTITDLFEAVSDGSVHYSIVPFENTTEGVVTHTIDMFRSYDVRIASEFYLPISNCLLSMEKDLSRIRKIYSHRQAISQTRRWVEANLPWARIIETDSTAVAAMTVRKMKAAAAIASAAAARIYGLRILGENIQDLETNVTRFVVLSRENVNRPTGRDKTSVLFTVKDQPGALYSILSCFKSEGVNMSKIESRPFRGRAWEYFFFVDLSGHQDDGPIRKSLSRIAKKTIDLNILGSYPAADGDER